MNILTPPTEYAAELFVRGWRATSREDSKEIVTELRKFPAAPHDYILEVLNELKELEFKKWSSQKRRDD